MFFFLGLQFSFHMLLKILNKINKSYRVEYKKLPIIHYIKAKKNKHDLCGVRISSLSGPIFSFIKVISMIIINYYSRCPKTPKLLTFNHNKTFMGKKNLIFFLLFDKFNFSLRSWYRALFAKKKKKNLFFFVLLHKLKIKLRYSVSVYIVWIPYSESI